MKLPLSNRLLACCGFVRPGDRVADVGCDHGYLGIHLLQTGIASSVIASDVNEGPLQSACRNAHKYGLKDRISFYLSDGVRSIPRDFDTLVCAGMGADTMISILEAAPWLKDEKYRLILQCQSRRPELRKYLYAQGFSITRETLAEDGKFIYPIMEVVYAPAEPLSPGGYHITPALLESGSPLLPAFLERIIGGLKTSVEGLSRTGGEKYEAYAAILAELEKIKL
jgi:tRNA (adenine22-N1)-methyltransferase